MARARAASRRAPTALSSARRSSVPINHIIHADDITIIMTSLTTLTGRGLEEKL
jgi:hypothetical protein